MVGNCCIETNPKKGAPPLLRGMKTYKRIDRLYLSKIIMDLCGKAGKESQMSLVLDFLYINEHMEALKKGNREGQAALSGSLGHNHAGFNILRDVYGELPRL